MADKKLDINLTTMEGQTAAWEDTYAQIASGSIDHAQATNRIRTLRGVYILRVEGPTRMLALLARLGKESEEIRNHAVRLTNKVMGTLSAPLALTDEKQDGDN